MLGGCIENSWLSARLNTQGFDQAHIGQIFAGYGIVVAITSGYPASVWTFLVLKGDGYRFYRLSSGFRRVSELCATQP